MTIINIPVEYIDAFKKDPARALRDLGAVPSLAIESYYPDPMVIERNWNRKREKKSPWDDVRKQFKEWWICDDADTRPRYIHVDLALKHDACGLAMGCHNGMVDMDNEKKSKVYFDLMLKIKAPKGGEIKFGNIRQLIYAIKDRGFRIELVSYDGWQSIDSQQILESRGITAEQLSVDKDLIAHDTLKSCIIDKRADYYPYKPFFEEIKSLELIKGKKVDHPPKGSKDVADAMAGVAFWVCQLTSASGEQIGYGGSYLQDEKDVMKGW